ncbi:ArsR family transcriptional regulator [Cyanobacterium sp. HL-69]|nr:ArsR family transcriptional regulator [Cyanobacterium sp. HL-69]OEJ78363.1 ArsR family transcriptional regulator [Cyanobacterium sp. IPPAS B-1200]
MSSMPTSDLSGMLSCFRALSDPIRLNVINLLQEKEMCVGDICLALKIAQPKLSFHLRVLRESGLLQTRQEGRWIYYRLNPLQFQVLMKSLADFAMD